MREKKFKYRVYSFYQFFTFIGIILIIIGILSFVLNASSKNIPINITFWTGTLKQVLIFDNVHAIGIFSSLWLYFGMFFLVITYPTGLSIIKIKNKSIFDRMFLLFIFAPVISNIFALLAQMYIDALKQQSERISKDEIEATRTQIFETFNQNKDDIEKEVANFKPLFHTTRIKTKLIKSKVRLSSKKNSGNRNNK